MKYEFKNAYVNLKDGAEPLNEAKLRQATVYARLMLGKGTKFGSITQNNQFYLSEKGTSIKAELFVLGSKNQIIVDHRVYVNVNIDVEDIFVDEANKAYIVELIHPTLNVSKLTKLVRS